MSLQHILTPSIAKAIQDLFEVSVDKVEFQATRKEFEGDITMVIFPLLKLVKSNPVELGNKIGNYLVENVPEVARFNVVSGFLNIVISDSYYLNFFDGIKDDVKYGFVMPNPSDKAVMVEYSSPNTNKPLHLGHLRNNFLGFSVAEILKANGHKVVRTQVINDRGIHICKSMLAWEKFSPLNDKGERETPANTGMKGDKLVGKYYVAFDKALQAEAKELMAKWAEKDFSDTPTTIQEAVFNFEAAKAGKDEKACAALDDKIKELAKNQTEILKEAKEMLVKWEARDPQVYLLWTTMNGWVYAGFDQTYAKMGVSFDKLYYESDTFLLGKDQVMQGLAAGVFYQKPDGSVWIDLSADGLDEKLVLRSDGTAVYMTQDIGTAIDRFADYPDLHGMVYTVGNEQDYHFKVLFLILKKLGYTWADNCFHLSYGMVDLPSGKMKSREGTVVDADDLIDEVTLAAKEMTQERGHLEGLNDEERNQLYSQIGLGGLKYYLLKVDPKKRMLFDPAESIDLTGNTGPFIQYSYARIQSILRKVNRSIPEKCKVTSINKNELALILELNKFEEQISIAAESYSPAIIANYVYELAKAFNKFYHDDPISQLADTELQDFRLMLCVNTAKVIRKSFAILGIAVPERM